MEGVPPVSLLHKFENDETFAPFLHEDFDPNAYTSDVVESGMTSRHLEKLSTGVAEVGREIHAEVVSRHEELLGQVGNVEDLERVMEVVRHGVNGLQSVIDRIRTELQQPYKQLQARTKQLANLQEASELLRRVSRYLHLVKKLQSQIEGGTKELTKAAQSVHEIESILAEGELEGIDVVDVETEWIRETGKSVRAQSWDVLWDGITSLNQAEIGSGLQVFSNLNCLVEKVGLASDRLASDVKRLVHTALEVSKLPPDGNKATHPGGITRSGAPPVGSSNTARVALWGRMEKLVDELYAYFLYVWHLQRVMEKKRNPVTHLSFLDEMIRVNKASVVAIFWKNLTNLLTEQIGEACAGSPFLRQTFTADYPKLRALLGGLWKRMIQEHDSTVACKSAGIDEGTLLRVIEAYEMEYLKQTFARLSDPVNLMFSGARPPTPADVKNLASSVNAEIKAVEHDDRLTLAVCRQVAKAIQLFVVRAESMVSSGPEAVQLVGGITTMQSRNAILYNIMQQLHKLVSLSLQYLPPTSADILQGALRSLDRLSEQILAPLFGALTRVLESILLHIHQENFKGRVLLAKTLDACGAESQYMQDLHHKINDLHAEFLGSYSTSPVLVSFKKTLATRVLSQFTRHVSLIRPLEEAGKLKLAADITQLEYALSPLFQPVEGLGASYRQLRALKPLLFLDTAQISSSPEVDILPPSIILHHLFSRCPSELLFPHMRMGWTAQQYSNWLEVHSEEEAWALLKESLDAYAQLLVGRGGREFPPEYSIILSLGPILVERWNTGHEHS